MQQLFLESLDREVPWKKTHISFSLWVSLIHSSVFLLRSSVCLLFVFLLLLLCSPSLLHISMHSFTSNSYVSFLHMYLYVYNVYVHVHTYNVCICICICKYYVYVYVYANIMYMYMHILCICICIYYVYVYNLQVCI